MEKLRTGILGKSFSLVRETVEVYIPMLAFAVMFLVFILQILFRYVLRQPLQWAYEVTVSCYLWLVLLGACYAQRERKHVSFNMLTNKLPVRARAGVIFLGNLLMLVAFVYALVPSIEFVFFMKMQKTAALKIGLDVIYFAYIPFMLIMIVYFLRDMVGEFRVLAGLAGEEEMLAFDRATRDDYEDVGADVEDVLDKIQEELK